MKNRMNVLVTLVALCVVVRMSASGELVVWWDFNEGHGATEAVGVKDLATTGGSHDGTTAGSASFSTDVPDALVGLGSRSVDLTSTTSYIVVDTYSGGASSNDFNMATNNLSVAFWLKRWAASNWASLVAKADGNNNKGWDLRRYSNGNDACLCMWPPTTPEYTGFTLGPNANWTHVAVTYDGSNIRHYTNGVLAYKKLSTTVHADYASNLFIARRVETAYITSGVMFDDMGIWNYVLSVAEIQDLANGISLIILPRGTVVIIY